MGEPVDVHAIMPLLVLVGLVAVMTAEVRLRNSRCRSKKRELDSARSDRKYRSYRELVLVLALLFQLALYTCPEVSAASTDISVHMPLATEREALNVSTNETLSIRGNLVYVWVFVTPTSDNGTAVIEMSSYVTNSTLFRRALGRLRASPTITIDLSGARFVDSYGIDVIRGGTVGVYTIVSGVKWGYAKLSVDRSIAYVTVSINSAFCAYLHPVLYINNVRYVCSGTVAVVHRQKVGQLFAECAETRDGVLIAVDAYLTMCKLTGVYTTSLAKVSTVPLEEIGGREGVAILTPANRGVELCPNGINIVCPGGANFTIPVTLYRINVFAMMIPHDGMANLTVVVIPPLKLESGTVTATFYTNEGLVRKSETIESKRPFALIPAPEGAGKAFVTVYADVSTEYTLLFKKVYPKLTLVWFGSVERSWLPIGEMKNIATAAFGIAPIIVIIAIFIGVILNAFYTWFSMGLDIKRSVARSLEIFMSPILGWLLFMALVPFVGTGLDAMMEFVVIGRELSAMYTFLLGVASTTAQAAITYILYGAIALAVASGIASYLMLSVPILAPIAGIVAESAAMAIDRLREFLTALTNKLMASGNIVASLSATCIAFDVISALVAFVMVACPILAIVFGALSAVPKLTKPCVAAMIACILVPYTFALVGLPFAKAIVNPDQYVYVLITTAVGQVANIGSGIAAALADPKGFADTVATAIRVGLSAASLPALAPVIYGLAVLVSLMAAGMIAAVIERGMYMFGATLHNYMQRILYRFLRPLF